jgi:hypothetical protein
MRRPAMKHHREPRRLRAQDQFPANLQLLRSR